MIVTTTAVTSPTADERDPVVTDSVVLSYEDGRWSVSLRRGAARTADAAVATKQRAADAA
jgi:hypothetical protein